MGDPVSDLYEDVDGRRVIVRCPECDHPAWAHTKNGCVYAECGCPVTEVFS